MNSALQRLLDDDAARDLDAVTPEELLAPADIVSPEDARLVKAALYLKHGFLDRCHKIAQQVETPNGSYWHAIMHRKEGDFSNSKYWYRRAGLHPVFARLGPDWDPFAFVDDCERNPTDRTHRLEQREFDLLLEHTIRCATAKP
jgi:hypothetical protein